MTSFFPCCEESGEFLVGHSKPFFLEENLQEIDHQKSSTLSTLESYIRPSPKPFETAGAQQISPKSYVCFATISTSLNMSTLASLIVQESLPPPPNHQNGVPTNKLHGIPQTGISLIEAAGTPTGWLHFSCHFFCLLSVRFVSVVVPLSSISLFIAYSDQRTDTVGETPSQRAAKGGKLRGAKSGFGPPPHL